MKITNAQAHVTEIPNFEPMEGLVAVVTQTHDTSKVLMVGYMNQEAWDSTLSTGKVHYYSRKKKRIWVKGEQSGNYQFVKQIFINCDRTSLLIEVEQIGGACDLGFESCFYRTLEDSKWATVETKVFDPKDAYGQNFTENITLGIPSGSLEKITFKLLKFAGFEIERESDRSYQPIVKNDPTIKLIMARAQELPNFVEEGYIDSAITGLDVVAESGNSVQIVCDLKYNKLGLGPVYIAVASPITKKFQQPRDLEGLRITTLYPSITEKFLHHNGVSAKVIPSIGATEGKVPFIADIVVDLVETGTTLKANNLKPIWGICETTVHFIVGNNSWGYTWKRRSLERLAQRLAEATLRLPKNPKKLVEINVLSSFKDLGLV